MSDAEKPKHNPFGPPQDAPPPAPRGGQQYGQPQQGGQQYGQPQQGGQQYGQPQQGGQQYGQPAGWQAGPPQGNPGGQSHENPGHGQQPPQNFTQPSQQFPPSQPGATPHGFPPAGQAPYGQQGSAQAGHQGPPQGPPGFQNQQPGWNAPQPGPYGFGPTGQPVKSSNPVPLIVAAVVLVLIVAVVGVLFLRGGDDSDTASTGNDNSGGESVSASKPSDAVRGYLEALGAGDADKALSYLETQPVDKTFLTSEVLKSASEEGAITNINVPEVSDKFAYQVASSYTIAGQQVSEDYTVTEVGGNWRVTRAVMDLDLSYSKKSSLPMLINGKAVTSNKVALFPGTYAFTTDLDYVNYGDEATTTTTGPSTFFKSPRLDPTLTAAGTTAVRKAITTALDACVAKRELAPSGCPNQIKQTGSQKVNKSTIRWTLTRDPLESTTLRVDYDKPSQVSVSLFPSFRFKASGTENGAPQEFSNGFVSNAGVLKAKVDLTQTPLKATFSTS